MPMDMKQYIAQTFAKMVEEKPVDRITVKELVGRCGISRQTFYYHFHDLMEVMEWITRENAARVVRRCLDARRPVEAARILVSCAMENQELVKRLANSKKKAELQDMLLAGSRAYLLELYRRRGVVGDEMTPELEFSVEFCAYGLAGVLKTYCEREDRNVTWLVDRVNRLLSENLPGMD